MREEEVTSIIEIVDYDPRWPIMFEMEKAAILHVIGDRFLEIEHIGSIAVPGLLTSRRTQEHVCSKCFPSLNAKKNEPPQVLAKETIREKVVREIVKIRCRHCGTLYEEMSRCPNCNAP